MFSLIRSIFFVLDARERRRFYLLGLGSMFAAFIQLVGVGIIAPFVALVLEPTKLQKYEFLAYFYHWLGFQSESAFLLAFGVLVALIMIFGSASAAAMVWFSAHFSFGIQRDLSVRLFRTHLAWDYQTLLCHKSAELSRHVLFDAANFSLGGVLQVTQLLTQGILVLFIVSFMAWFDPWVTAVTTLVISAVYLLLFILLKGRHEEYATIQVVANRQRLQSVSEAYSSLKVIKIFNREDFYLRKLAVSAGLLARAATYNQVASRTPRYIVESATLSLAIVGIALAASSGASIQASIPVAAGFMFAAYKLVPAAQQIFLSVQNLRFNVPAIQVISRMAREQGKGGGTVLHQQDGGGQIRLRSTLEIQNLSYSYPSAKRFSLHGVSIKIKHPSFIGFVGASGAGKTSCADIIAGLLLPTDGRVLVDGFELKPEDLSNWRHALGYVPQDPVLIDDTIAANIAFGEAPEKRDSRALRRAAELAQLLNFVNSELPLGFDTQVGERGVALSGGQRQRIGLARALYRNPDVLILDEATSALDAATEQDIQSAIQLIANEKTVIVIAHRLSTIEACQELFVFESGRVVDCGTYAQLSADSAAFKKTLRAMAKKQQGDSLKHRKGVGHDG